MSRYGDLDPGLDAGKAGNMTRRQALRIAAECIQEKMKPLAFGANNYKLGIKTPANENQYYLYQRLAEALREIEAEVGQEQLF